MSKIEGLELFKIGVKSAQLSNYGDESAIKS